MTVDVRVTTIDQYDNETYGEITFATPEGADQYIKEVGRELEDVGYLFDYKEGVWKCDGDTVVITTEG